jgi:DNA-binding transcriptional ArsR family regulator
MLFDSLNDEDACAIMKTLDETSLSAKEVSERCELSMSTTYRKLNQLSEVGLLEEQTEITLEGKHLTRFHRCIDTIAITITDNGFELELSGGDLPEKAVLRA